MDFVQANKGVIITTSQFSKEAYDFIHKIVGKKVVLIDGEQVAALMLEYNIGVNRSKVYEVKELSNDFFDEDNEPQDVVKQLRKVNRTLEKRLKELEVDRYENDKQQPSREQQLT